MIIEEINDSFNDTYKEEVEKMPGFNVGDQVEYVGDSRHIKEFFRHATVTTGQGNTKGVEITNETGTKAYVAASELKHLTPIVDKKVKQQDEINKPSHYHQGGLDVIGYAEMKLTPEQLKGAYRFNVMKYITRYEDKGQPLKDLRKCRVYLDKLIEMESDTK